jgi:adenosine deaminase
VRNERREADERGAGTETTEPPTETAEPPTEVGRATSADAHARILTEALPTPSRRAARRKPGRLPYDAAMDPRRPAANGEEELGAWLAAMPKAELHLHLDGSLRPATALELARAAGPDAPSLVRVASRGDLEGMRARLTAPERCLDQADLLRAFDLPVALLQDPASLARVTRELVEDVAGEGTRYVEIRWAPSLHVERGFDVPAVVEAVADAGRSAAVENGIVVRLIAVALRTHAPSVADDVARAAVAASDRGVAGFDLAGREVESPDPSTFARAFDIARDGGLGITCHAGEWDGADQVRRALAVAPSRIAHGAPAADDPELMARLRADGVTLDVCPTSNVQAGIGSWGPDAPLPRLIAAGVPVTISTDDRTVSDLTLVRELSRCVERLGIVPRRIEGIVRHAYEVAFLHDDEPLRARLLAAFDDWLRANPAPGAA